MSNIIYILVAGLIGYLFGAIPFGFWFVKITKNIDIRDIGSGRTGGTNAYRAAGTVVGILTGLTDVMKGVIAIWLVRRFLGTQLDDAWLPWAVAAGGVMAVVGHNWSIFFNWRGGAGTTPNVGWATAIWWPVFPIAFVVMAGLFLWTGMASVVSLTIAALLPIIFAIRYFMGMDTTAAYMVAGILTAAAVTWSLRPNIKRLITGTERVVGPRAKQQQMKNAES